MKNIKKQSLTLIEKKISLLSRYNDHLHGRKLDSIFILKKKRESMQR